MLKCLRILGGLVAFLLLSGTAMARSPAPLSTDPYWLGSYFNNMDLAGTPVLQRWDSDINFDWGLGSPAPGTVNANNFSVRWTRHMDLVAGAYRFTTSSDDGARVYVDGRLILDAWREYPVGTHNADINLEAGSHLIVVEYCESSGGSFMHFSIRVEPGTPVAQNWRGEYFNNIDLSGSPALVRDDGNVDFQWGDAAPAEGINADYFSVRWTRNLDLDARRYWFTLKVDDGARLWVNGSLLIDQWRDQPVRTYSASIDLPGGPVPVRLEYYERTGGAFVTLGWSTSSPDPVINNWRGEYYNNTSLSGSPALVRDDASINFDWGTGSPDPAISADNFSVRWTRNLNLSAGTYRFMMTMDDGCRLWVNGTLLLNDWSDQAANTHGANIYVPGGSIPVTFEYYERADNAVAKLWWYTVSNEPPAIYNWRGEYYNNTSLSGTPALVRDDASINFDWGTGSPDPAISADNFSVRWTRTVNFSAGTYRFTASMDDGVRLWVNNQLVLDDWSDQAANTHSVDVYVPGGDIPLRYEYYERGDRAVAKLSWAAVTTPAPVPQPETVLVDDGDPAFKWGGLSSSMYRAYYGWGGDLFWTRNDDWARTGYNWGAWYPSLSAATYEVFAHIPAQSGATRAARYWVFHADGKTMRVVDQNSSVARWASLGTYRFRGTSADYVTLTDVTYEAFLSRIVTWDAVKWERR